MNVKEKKKYLFIPLISDNRKIPKEVRPRRGKVRTKRETKHADLEKWSDNNILIDRM